VRAGLAVLYALIAALWLAGSAHGADLTFGSTLSQPPTTDVDAPATCDPSGANEDLGPCTRVAVGFAATGAVADRVTAPASGVIRRVRVRASTPTTMRLTLARVRNFDREGGLGEARVVSRGTVLRVRGLAQRTPVESFRVNLKVRKGDHLAVVGESTSALRCDGGNTEQLLFVPPLGGEFQPSTHYDDCTLLVQATVATPRKKKRSR
jgi:hypothetical protein